MNVVGNADRFGKTYLVYKETNFEDNEERNKTKQNKHLLWQMCTLFSSEYAWLDFLTLGDGTDRLSQTVGAELPLYAA
jgi:hypothetical protein